ncbi:MAG: hypothetical protein RIT45_2648 [Pseudomonadota bacterium]|jgi:DNA-binding beta-propeller fold protein YncE
MLRLARPSLLLLAALAASAASGCSEEYDLPADPSAGVRYPVAMAADPSGRWLYVVGANFDRAYHGGVVRVIDTASDTYVAAQKVEVPSFASAAVLDVEPAADGSMRRTLLVASREDDSVTAIDVRVGADATVAPDLDCGNGTGTLKTCAASHRVGGDETGDLDIGEDPAAIALEQRPDGARVLHVVATADGQVTPLRLSFPEAGGVTALADDQIGLGSGLAAVLHAPLVGRTYVSDARANRLHAYDVTPGEDGALQIQTFAGVTLPSAASTEFGRGIALSSDEGRLYVAYRNPNALLVVDVAPTPSGEPHDTLGDVIGLGGRPAQLAVAPVGPGGRDLVFVACHGTDDIWVVDPALRRVVDVIRLPHSPYAITVVDVPGKGLQLYTALFSTHQVLRVPLTPGADGRFTVAETIE